MHIIVDNLSVKAQAYLSIFIEDKLDQDVLWVVDQELVDCTVGICLGANALYKALGLRGIGKHRGWHKKASMGVTYHPDYAMNNDMVEQFEQDIISFIERIKA